MTVLESEIAPALAAALPDAVPGAPWDAVLDAVVWWHRAAPGAARHVDPSLRPPRAVPLTVGAFVRYRSSPVGPYREVFGVPVFLPALPLPAGTVPFMAVDSVASVAGGRRNWGFPKVLATFGPGPSAQGEDWAVEARVRARRRRVPLPVGAGVVDQPAPDGAGAARMLALGRGGTVRVGTADVRTEGPTLPGWLLCGRHPAVVLTGVRATFAAPRRRPDRRGSPAR